MQWVRKNATRIRFAPNPTWPPGEFLDDSGNYRGIVADYVAIIEQKLGVAFPRVKFNTWDEIIQALKTGQADWVAGIHKNEERSQYLEFTDVYLQVPVVVLCKENIGEKFQRQDTNFRLACTRGYATLDYVKTKYTWMRIVECQDDVSGVLMASLGKVDGIVLDVMTASYLIQKYAITNLAYAGETGFKYEIAMAVRKEYAPLATILNKILHSVTPQEKEKIYKKWVNIDVTQSSDYQQRRIKRIFNIILISLSILALFAGIFVSMLKREVKRKIAALALANEKAALLVEELKRQMLEKIEVAKGLEQTTRKLEDIFNAVNDGIIIIDIKDFAIIECNTRVLQMLCVDTCSQLHLKSLLQIDMLAGSSLNDILEKAIQMGSHRAELEVRCLDEKSGWVELNLKKVFIHQKECLLIVIRDITDFKHYDMQLRHALAEARQSDRLKSAFLKNISHEFRTPMNGIMGFASLLRDKNLRDEYLDVYLDRIEASGQRLLDLIDKIVEISRFEAGEINYSPEPIKLLNFLEEIKNDFALEAELKGFSILVKSDITCPGLICHTDPAALRVVIKHILNNAIKYSHDSLIELGFYKKTEEIELYVRDNGIGIPRERLEAVFNAFEQADPEDTDAREGIGLGLTIAKKYIHLLGGQIWIESTVGKGTTVYVSLPCQR